MKRTITVDLNIRCARCGKRGAAYAGHGPLSGDICLKCMAKAVKTGELKVRRQPPPGLGV